MFVAPCRLEPQEKDPVLWLQTLDWILRFNALGIDQVTTGLFADFEIKIEVYEVIRILVLIALWENKHIKYPVGTGG